MRPLLLITGSALVFYPTTASPGGPCNPTLDPPTQARYNSDFGSIQLPSNATLSICSDLCCATPGCVAFSFNSPQPVKVCIENKCCIENSVCCMLKNGYGDLQKNPYPPGQVTTGVVKEPPPLSPGPTPPFPPSTLILNVSFGPVGFWSDIQGGDTWPSAWASDGRTYGWDCDAHGSPMSLWSLPATPYNVTPTLVGSVQAIDYTTLCRSYGPTGSFPKINVKPSGMVALGDGTLLVGISCMQYGDDPAFNRQHNLGGFLATSRDYGVSWKNATPVGSLFTGRLSAPAFVSCGQANAPCSAKDGGWLYVFFPGSVDDESYWDNNDGLWLGRVPEAQPTNTSAYEFYAGMGGGNSPRWTNDPLQAEPTLTFPLMVGENPVMWIPSLGRYIFCNFGFIDEQGNPRPWHTEPYMMPHRTQLVLLESPTPWGPWSMFYRSDDSPPAPGLYTPTFPSQWVQERVGDTVVMGMAFACLGGAESCRYTLNYVNVTLTLAA